MTPAAAGLILASYFVGAIPFGLLIAKAIGAGDIRKQGSGNIGATNVLRSAGPVAGAATFLLDFFKGTGMVLLAGYIAGPIAAVGSAVAAVLGHNFPVFLKFKGGKGVAVGAGVFMALSWKAVASVLVIFAVVVLLSRIVSLASLVASGMFPPLAWLFGSDWAVVGAGVLVVTLIFIRHHANIARLIRGKEPKFGGGGKPPADAAAGARG